MRIVDQNEITTPTPKEKIQNWGQVLTAVGLLHLVILLPMYVYYDIESSRIYIVYYVVTFIGTVSLLTGVCTLMKWRLAYPLLKFVSGCVMISPILGYLGTDLSKILRREDVKRMFR